MVDCAPGVELRRRAPTESVANGVCWGRMGWQLLRGCADRFLSGAGVGLAGHRSPFEWIQGLTMSEGPDLREGDVRGWQVQNANC